MALRPHFYDVKTCRDIATSPPPDIADASSVNRHAYNSKSPRRFARTRFWPAALSRLKPNKSTMELSRGVISTKTKGSADFIACGYQIFDKNVFVSLVFATEFRDLKARQRTPTKRKNYLAWCLQDCILSVASPAVILIKNSAGSIFWRIKDEPFLLSA